PAPALARRALPAAVGSGPSPPDHRGRAGKGKIAPDLRSARSGPWSAPSTWEGGKVPGPRTRVLIRTGHRVVYDVNSDRPIHAINIAGTLSFAPDRHTRLAV